MATLLLGALPLLFPLDWCRRLHQYMGKRTAFFFRHGWILGRAAQHVWPRPEVTAERRPTPAQAPPCVNCRWIIATRTSLDASVARAWKSPRHQPSSVHVTPTEKCCGDQCPAEAPRPTARTTAVRGRTTTPVRGAQTQFAARAQLLLWNQPGPSFAGSSSGLGELTHEVGPGWRNATLPMVDRSRN
jgi:hypothetical protein